jgi:hypothetical protein
MMPAVEEAVVWPQLERLAGIRVIERIKGIGRTAASGTLLARTHLSVKMEVGSDADCQESRRRQHKGSVLSLVEK